MGRSTEEEENFADESSDEAATLFLANAEYGRWTPISASRGGGGSIYV
jgi:hypothetical protein